MSIEAANILWSSFWFTCRPVDLDEVHDLMTRMLFCQIATVWHSTAFLAIMSVPERLWVCVLTMHRVETVDC